MASDLRASALHRGIALTALLVGLLLAAVLPATAAAVPGGPGCDFPVIDDTEENTETCAGDLEEVTGVDTSGPPAGLPPEVEPADDPVAITRCSRVAAVRSIRADNVDCATARTLASRANRRRKSYGMLGFTCQVSGRKVTCYRRAIGPEDGQIDGSDTREASQVVIVRQGDFGPRRSRR